MNLEEEIRAIKNRNQQVEMDKAWERSFFKRILILVIIYIFAVVFMTLIDVDHVYLNALVPALGFYLSTLSLGLCKKIWIKYFYNKRKFEV